MARVLHSGSDVIVSRADLDLISLPVETATYKPISHLELVKSMSTISQDMLKGYTLESEQYVLAREGQQLFGALTFKHNDFETGLSVGIRNSYDKSMSIGLCIGAQIMVCSNLSFSGEITFLKKHTLNVWKSLEDLAISTLYRSSRVHQEMTADFEKMKSIVLNNDHAYMLLGLLFGREVLGPRQLSVALSQWHKPNHEEFSSRTLYSLYNGATESLKSSSPIDSMDRYLNLHKIITLENDQWALA